jgi:hypothetical protein
MSSFETIGQLAKWTPQSTLVKLDQAGHGTVMLEKDPLLMDRIVLWLKEAASPQ